MSLDGAYRSCSRAVRARETSSFGIRPEQLELARTQRACSPLANNLRPQYVKNTTRDTKDTTTRTIRHGGRVVHWLVRLGLWVMHRLVGLRLRLRLVPPVVHGAGLRLRLRL